MWARGACACVKNSAQKNRRPQAPVWGRAARLVQAEGLGGVAGNHALFVGGHDGDGYPAGRGVDTRGVRFVGALIQFQTQPADKLDDFLANHRGVFANAAGEDERIQPLHGSGQRADGTRNAVAEQIHRFARFGRIRFEQVAHVLADARDAQQAGLFVEQLGDGGGIHVFALHEVEQHAGVDNAAARAHHETVDGGKAHRGGHALAVAQGTHGSAIAQVGDDDGTVGLVLPDDFRQLAGDVVIRQAVETIALDAFLRERAGNGIGLRQRRLGAVEGRIEAADLTDCGQQRPHGFDCAQVVRLVQRGERNEGFEFLHVLGRQAQRRAVFFAPVHDAVAGSGNVQIRVNGVEPVEQVRERAAVLLGLVAVERDRFLELAPVRSFRRKLRRFGADAFVLTGDDRAGRDALGRVGIQRVEGEFEAGRTSVEYEDGFHACCSLLLWTMS